MKQLDTQGEAIEIEGQQWRSKGQEEKFYQTPYGEIYCARHVYQHHGRGKPSALWSNPRASWVVKHPPNAKITATSARQTGAAVTYYKNHRHQMDNISNIEQNFPIGSGVIEAACKTLIKQRFCLAGMGWKQTGAAGILNLRALVLTAQRWTPFWQKNKSLWRSFCCGCFKLRSHP